MTASPRTRWGAPEHHAGLARLALALLVSTAPAVTGCEGALATAPPPSVGPTQSPVLASDAPEISRSLGAAGGAVVLWPRVVPKTDDPAAKRLARLLQARAARLAGAALGEGAAIDVRPEPERVCARGGCRGTSVGVWLAKKGDACAAALLVAKPGESPTRIVPLAGRLELHQEEVPFRSPPESQITVRELAPCDALEKALDQGAAGTALEGEAAGARGDQGRALARACARRPPAESAPRAPPPNPRDAPSQALLEPRDGGHHRAGEPRRRALGAQAAVPGLGGRRAARHARTTAHARLVVERVAHARRRAARLAALSPALAADARAHRRAAAARAHRRRALEGRRRRAVARHHGAPGAPARGHHAHAARRRPRAHALWARALVGGRAGHGLHAHPLARRPGTTRPREREAREARR
jgi:hypothetical protein